MKDSLYNPYKGLSYEEMEIIVNAGIYPIKPQMSKEDWQFLKEYIIAPVPDKITKLWQEKDVDILILENKLK